MDSIRISVENIFKEQNVNYNNSTIEACVEFLFRFFRQNLEISSKFQSDGIDEKTVANIVNLNKPVVFTPPTNIPSLEIVAAKLNNIPLPDIPIFDGIVFPPDENCLAVDNFTYIFKK
jgi:hypothetical protein